MNTADPSSGKSPGIEVLRAACVLYIVGFWHLMDYTHGLAGYNNAVTVRVTVTVLGLFTFMSGFLLARAPMRLRAPELKRFYARRLLRIYPLYLLALLAFWALGLADRGIALKAALGISMLYGPPPATLWFITMILVFYLVAPLLIALRPMPARFALAVVAIFGIVAIATDTASGDVRMAEYFPAFALGIWWAGDAAPAVGHAWLPATGAAAAAWVLSMAFADDPQFSLWAMPLATCGALAVFVLAGKVALSRDSRFARAAALVSDASFSMYLFHRVFYKGLHALYDPASGATGLGYLLLVCLPAVIAAGLFVQRACDISIRRLTVR